ncbi:MAG: 3-deoxy-7-phosphoheptulonate synthase, partial [Gammaproteobacteria bacterium]|nr:3-deoxy-7-phosphoheptulonate synthase [Gammaproteobacteria bacterium]
MTDTRLNNINVITQNLLPTPEEVKQALPINSRIEQTVLAGRDVMHNILDRKDPRLFVVVGPCSIHDPDAALEYADKLKALSEKVSDTLYLVMRVYFEKPRTTVGWKGLINDPNMDDSFHI